MLLGSPRYRIATADNVACYNAEMTNEKRRLPWWLRYHTPMAIGVLLLMWPVCLGVLVAVLLPIIAWLRH